MVNISNLIFNTIVSLCSLAAQREQFIRDKQEQQDMYKNALEAQVGHAPNPSPTLTRQLLNPV